MIFSENRYPLSRIMLQPGIVGSGLQITPFHQKEA